MRYIRNGEWHQMVRVSGPSHNLLGLVLVHDEGEAAPLLVEQAGPTQDAAAVLLRADDVVTEVREGIRQANKRLGTRYVATKLRFLPTDTPPEKIYARLAEEIVSKVASEDGHGFLQAAG